MTENDNISKYNLAGQGNSGLAKNKPTSTNGKPPRVWNIESIAQYGDSLRPYNNGGDSITPPLKKEADPTPLGEFHPTKIINMWLTGGNNQLGTWHEFKRVTKKYIL